MSYAHKNKEEEEWSYSGVRVEEEDGDIMRHFGCSGT
jgi:hypothetical protein